MGNSVRTKLLWKPIKIPEGLCILPTTDVPITFMKGMGLLGVIGLARKLHCTVNGGWVIGLEMNKNLSERGRKEVLRCKASIAFRWVNGEPVLVNVVLH